MAAILFTKVSELKYPKLLNTSPVKLPKKVSGIKKVKIKYDAKDRWV